MFSGTAGKVLSELQRFDLKEDGAGKYRLNSPFRPGSNSHGFTLSLEDDEHGAYYDHVSHDTGSLYDLAKRLGIEIAGAAPVASTKRAYSGIDDYAAAHGVTAEYLTTSGWVESFYQDRHALAFKTQTGTRWRFLDDKQPHYKSEKGYRASWYGLTPSLARRLATGGSLVICNGEISTVAARFHKLPATCVTGGEKAIPDNLIEQLKSFFGNIDEAPPIIVAFDCDDTGRRAGRLVCRQLRDAGFIARAVDLGLSKGGDLADFCMLHGENVSRELNLLPAMSLENDIAPAVSRNWYIIPAVELRNLPPIEWIVKGEIPARGITVLFGASGAGKSFLALDYALTIAQDQPVVYMAGEGEYGYRQRVAAWCQHHGKPEGRLFMCIGAVQLMETDDLDAFLRAIQAIRPVMVIIDTMSKSMIGSDENSTRDMGLFVQACEKVKRDLDTTVLIVHHTNKGGVHERGNSALRGASDAMIRVTAEDDLIRVDSAKTKDASPFPTRYIQLLTVPIEIDGQMVDSAVAIESDRIIQSPDDPLTPNQLQTLKLLGETPFGASRNEIAETSGVPYHSLQRILSQLRKLDYVKVDGYGKPYTITQTGLDRLDRLDRVDRGPGDDTQENHSDQPDQPDQLGGKVDRLDRTSAGESAAVRSQNSDPGLSARDQLDQPALIPVGDNYYAEGL